MVDHIGHLSPEFHQEVRRTTFVEAPRLEKRLEIGLIFASETFQRTGSFKFRAAYNVALNVPHPEIIAASSGNFGQAIAFACGLLGKKCTVVMPSTSARVKIDAVREYGAQVDLTDVRVKGREARLAELAIERPDAYVASPYNDLLVIEGNASLGWELAAMDRRLDYVIAPVGGGGLSSGIITGLNAAGSNIKVIGAEPSMANDAALSLKAGHLIRNDAEPMTIADGARTISLGERNWNVLREGMERIIEVPEENIRQAVRLLFTHANLKAEPTGALSLGAVLTQAEELRGHSVCCVVSGGNVDPEVYRSILAG